MLNCSYFQLEIKRINKTKDESRVGSWELLKVFIVKKTKQNISGTNVSFVHLCLVTQACEQCVTVTGGPRKSWSWCSRLADAAQLEKIRFNDAECSLCSDNVGGIPLAQTQSQLVPSRAAANVSSGSSKMLSLFTVQDSFSVHKNFTESQIICRGHLLSKTNRAGNLNW